MSLGSSSRPSSEGRGRGECSGSAPESGTAPGPTTIANLPDLQALFGSLDYFQCEDCQSVYSPAAYLVDFLKAAASGDVRLELKDAQSAGQFRPAEGDDYKYRYIVMPMRI